MERDRIMLHHALRFGAIAVDRIVVQRTGLRWTVQDGHRCEAGEVVAYCNIKLVPASSGPGMIVPFADEKYDLQLTLAVSTAGILHIRSDVSFGGWLDQNQYLIRWDADEIAADLETAAEITPGDHQPRLLLGGAVGRRVTSLAEDHSGLLTGWHNRARAWHGELDGHLSLLSLGICEQTGLFRGERNGFFELLAEAPAALHAIYVGDEALVPCSRILLEQSARSDTENARIAEDMMRGLADVGVPVTPSDLLFAGSTLAALTRRPFADRFDLLTRNGLHVGAIDAVVLSGHSDPGMVLRHKRLGYHAFWHRFRISDAGPAIREWLHIAFEPVRRTLDDVARDLAAVTQVANAAGIRHVLVLNKMSSSGHEDIVSYQPFNGQLGEQIGTIAAKESNLMLHDVASTSDISIIDTDAIAAAIGGRAHLPDGVHQSGRMQSELRREILHVLQQRGAFNASSERTAA